MSQRFDYYSQSPALAKGLYELSLAVHRSSLGDTLLDLVNIRASQLNGCAFCLDMHTKEAKIHGEGELCIYHLSIWRESTLFSETERAALEWTEAVTKLSDHGVTDKVYDRVRAKLSEAQISELTFAIGVATPRCPQSSDRRGQTRPTQPTLRRDASANYRGIAAPGHDA